jgi:hypothetical protein
VIRFNICFVVTDTCLKDSDTIEVYVEFFLRGRNLHSGILMLTDI